MITPYYERDNVTIYHGDCREVMSYIKPRTIGAIITDPPYGMNRFETDGKDYLESVGPALHEAWTLLKDNAPMFVFTSTAEIVNVSNAIGQPLKRMFWMYKPADMTFPFAGWLLTSEAILWFHKGKRINLVERKPYHHDCYIHRRVGLEGVEGHPTVKPLWIISDFVLRIPEEATILDPYMGSGTTAIACLHAGRRFIGIEIEQKYCDIAVERIEKALMQPQLLTA